MRYLLIILTFYQLALAQPGLIGSTTSGSSLGESTQQKSFVDEATGWVYQFYNDGTQIVVKSSQDTTSWQNAALLPYNTSDFSITYKENRVLMAISHNSNDIVIRRGFASNGSISFESEITIFDGTGAYDRFFHPSIGIASSGEVYVGAVHVYSSDFFQDNQAKVRISTNIFSNSLSSFNSPLNVGLPAEDLNALVIIGDTPTTLIHNSDGQLFAYIYNGTSWTPSNEGGGATVSGYKTAQGINSYVESAAVFGGDLYLGGSFSSFLEIPNTEFIVRYDGTNFHSINAGLDGRVEEMIVYGGELIFSGTFREVQGDTQLRRIARFDGTNFNDLGGRNCGFAWVADFAIYSGDLIIAGCELIAPSNQYVYSWNGTTVSSINFGTGNLVTSGALEVFGGELYLGGSFTNGAGIAAADYIAKWNGTTFSDVGGGLNNAVSDMEVYAGNLYVAGNFTNAGGDPSADYITYWDGAGYNSLGGGVNGNVNLLSLYDSKLHLSGGFTDADGLTVSQSATWNGTTFETTFLPPIGIGGIGGIINYSGSDYAYGTFNNADDIASNDYLAVINGTALEPIEDNLGSLLDVSYPGFEFLRHAGELYMYGGFTFASGTPGANYFTRWNGESFEPLGTLNSFVSAATVFQGQIYIGGGFADVGGDPNSDGLARWNGTAWEGLGVSTSSIIYDFEVYNNELYIIGSFSDLDGDPLADRVARYDGTNFNNLGVSFPSGVLDAQTYNGELYIAGYFQNVGGDANADHLVLWDGTNISSFFTVPDDDVRALSLFGGELWLGGYFTDLNGDPAADYLVTWDGTNISTPLTGLDNNVSSLNVDEGELFISGSFTGYTGNPTAAAVLKYNGTDYAHLDISQTSHSSPFYSFQEQYVTYAYQNDISGFTFYSEALSEDAISFSASLFGSNLQTFIQSNTNSLDYRTKSGSAWQGLSNVSIDSSTHLCSGSNYYMWRTAAGSIKYLESGSGVQTLGNGDNLSCISTTDTLFYSYENSGVIYSSFLGEDPVVDPDGDGLTNTEEIALGTNPNIADTDGDGLNDGDEVNLYSTNPLLADTDSDGINDSSEITLGYNPHQHDYPLDSPAYLGWNSFLKMTNVLELSNRSNTFQSITVKILNSAGLPLTSFSIGLASGEKRDILLDEYVPTDEYGNVKLEFTSHAIRAQTTLYYGTNPNYVYNNEGRNGLTGTSFLLFNTINPSTSENLVTENWVSISNLSSSSEFFALTKYNQDGSIIESNGIIIDAESRFDVFGGPNEEGAGFIKIEPMNPTTPYLADLTRQAYDSLGTYQYATTSEAMVGKTNSYASLAGNSYIEVANVCDTTEEVSVNIYQEDGTLDFQSNYSLAAHTHTHIGSHVTGLVHAASSNPCILMSVFRYQGNVSGLSTSEGQNPKSGLISGRYNTFLNQVPTLQISNTSSSAQAVTVTFRDAQGEPTVESTMIEPLASSQIPIGGTTDSYGTIDVSGNSLIASVLYSAPTFSDSHECR